MGFGEVTVDEEGNLSGGNLFADSPIGRALHVAQTEGRLSGFAELAKYAIMGRGGLGPPKWITPKDIIRRPHMTPEGVQLPSIADLYKDMSMRGQPLPAQSIAREAGALPSKVRNGPPIGPQPIGEPNLDIASAVQRANAQHPQSQLQALQNLLITIFTAQSRQ
jgi:hypothetical protein